jgi:hypothetical protein
MGKFALFKVITMSNISVACATSTHASTEVVGRTTLSLGAVVELVVPSTARKGYTQDESIPYLQFARTVKGGLINCFVHTDDESLRGMTILAEVKVMQKSFADGREYLYLDYIPKNSSNEPTHRLITTDAIKYEVVEGWQVFKTPQPLRGMIILMPPDGKLQKAALPAPVSTTRLGNQSTGDSQLDRLITDGWEVESEENGVVNLFKTKKGKRHEMKHLRKKK